MVKSLVGWGWAAKAQLLMSWAWAGLGKQNY